MYVSSAKFQCKIVRRFGNNPFISVKCLPQEKKKAKLALSTCVRAVQK